MTDDARRIIIPYSPRQQFAPYHNRTQRWSVLVCHRRAGKTVAVVNDQIRKAMTLTLPNPRLAYLAPQLKQAKAVAWDYLKYYSSRIPDTVIRESDLSVRYPNGAVYRLYGSDNPDALRGIYLDDVSLDEAGDMPPNIFPEILRPALSDRRGSATFIGTPKGDNYFKETWDKSADNPDWFRMMLKASETNLIDPDELKAAREQMTPEQYAQEYECSFTAAIVGAYYGHEMEAAENEGRIGILHPEAYLQTHVIFDLGMDDATAIWFVQIVGNEVRLVEYLEDSGFGLPHYVQQIRQRDYNYGKFVFPPDVAVRELSTGLSRIDTLRGLGINPTIVAQHRIEDGINAVRMMLPNCRFDRAKCAHGIKALVNYQRSYDPIRKAFSNRPRHDWSSHGADSFRYLAMAKKTLMGQYETAGPLRRRIAIA